MNYYERVLKRINESTYISKYLNSNAICILEVGFQSKHPNIEYKVLFTDGRSVKFNGVPVPLSIEEVEQLYDVAITKYHNQQADWNAKVLEEL
jgi:hypothetical protein